MTSGGTHRPHSFRYDCSHNWGVWVLDHGCRLFPRSARTTEVPIADWGDPTFGAVLSGSWWSD